MLSTNAAQTPEPRGLSRGEIEHYLAHQGDPMVGEHTGRWRLERHGARWDLTSSLPIKMSFNIEEPIDWGALGDHEPQSEALWKYSAGYLPSLLVASGDEPLVTDTVFGLAAYVASDAWEGRASWMTSIDHAYATRIRALCTLAVLYQDGGHVFPRSAKELLAHDVGALMDGSEKYFPANNHGAMAAIALIHAARVFKNLGPASPVGWGHLRRILEELFDRYGLVGENSPEYQMFWIRFLAPFDALLEVWPARGDDASMLHDLAGGMKRALAHFTDHNQNLIPIGDSHARKSIVEPVRDDVRTFERHGFGTYSFEQTLVTMSCGHSNYAHKHCDDTSITLAYRGVSLILDSGYFGHDWNDPRVIYSKSQSAHSGVFLEEFDDLHPGKLYFPGKERLKGSISALKNGIGWEGVVEVEDGRHIIRRLTFLDPRRIQIDDYVETRGLASAAVQRFMIPRGAAIKVLPDRVSVTFQGVQMDLEFGLERGGCEVRVHSGIEVPVLRGWSSSQPQQLDPGCCIELTVVPDNSSKVIVTLTDNA